MEQIAADFIPYHKKRRDSKQVIEIFNFNEGVEAEAGTEK